MTATFCSFCGKSHIRPYDNTSTNSVRPCDKCAELAERLNVKKEDKLTSMFEQQRAFMVLLHEHRNFPDFPTDVTSKKGQQFLDGITYHVMKELFEAGQHLKNHKSHRATEITEFDREKYVEELIDALHLYFEICIAAGISLEELFDAYMKKGEINSERIRNGY